MGTDIYLNWDGKSEEEQQAQYTGFSIQAGNVGYLRASIGMHLENTALRMIFPGKFWHHESTDPRDKEDGPEYDFAANQSLVVSVLERYLKAVENHEEVEHPMPEMRQMEKTLTTLFAGLGYTTDRPGSNNDLYGAQVWAKSVAEFFQLGLTKQNEGKHPRVLISW